MLYGGANQRQDRGQIRKVLDAFSPGDALLLQNEINELEYLLLLAFERGMKIILNPSPIDEELLKSDLSAVGLFVMNEVEGEALTGKQAPEEMLEEMRRQYPKASFLLTLGENGAYYQRGENRWFQPAFPVDAADTTAAGDTFTGYFIAGLVSGLSPEENLRRSAKAASIAVSRKGAADSIPRFDEF